MHLPLHRIIHFPLQSAFHYLAIGVMKSLFRRVILPVPSGRVVYWRNLLLTPSCNNTGPVKEARPGVLHAHALIDF